MSVFLRIPKVPQLVAQLSVQANEKKRPPMVAKLKRPKTLQDIEEDDKEFCSKLDIFDGCREI